MSELDGDYAENQYCPIHLPLVAALSLKKEHKQDAEIKMECEEEKKGKNLLIGNITGGTVGLCVKRSPLPKVTPVRFPIGPQGFSRLSGFPPSGKSQTLVSWD